MHSADAASLRSATALAAVRAELALARSPRLLTGAAFRKALAAETAAQLPGVMMDRLAAGGAR